MNQTVLGRLLAERETRTLDRKLECHAFQGDQAANAELAKDICAMANNGSRHSYIVVGASDNGRELKSVKNTKLTDDNLQTLVRRTITPVPKVSLHEVEWAKGDQEFLLKVITVGPNARHAFSLAADMIDYKRGYCFRKHEVWIRRAATSDLATPLEVARLVEGEDPSGPGPEGPSKLFGRMDALERRDAIIEALGTASDRVAVDGDLEVIRILVSGKVLLLRLLYEESFESKERLATGALITWGFEHGVFVVSPSRPPAAYFTTSEPFSLATFSVTSREKWGAYVVMNVEGSGERAASPGLFRRIVAKAIKNGPPIQLPIFVLSNLQDTRSLTRRVHQLLQFLDEPDIEQRVMHYRAQLIAALRSASRSKRVLLAGWGVPPPRDSKGRTRLPRS